jgi:hypothetical protein
MDPREYRYEHESNAAPEGYAPAQQYNPYPPYHQEVNSFPESRYIPQNEVNNQNLLLELENEMYDQGDFVQQPQPQLAIPDIQAPPAHHEGTYTDNDVTYALRFHSLQAASDYRNAVTKLPTLDPNADNTIAHVENNEGYLVVEMMQAVYNLHQVGDQPKCHDINMFTLGYSDCVERDEVEATCHVLFHEMLFRCRHGFKGRGKNDRAARRTEDTTANCETRMRNVVECLRNWKNVCRDIVRDDAQIVMLANHPKARSTEKKNNKRTNDTRAATAKVGKEAKEREQNVRGQQKSQDYDNGRSKYTSQQPHTRPTHTVPHRPSPTQFGTNPFISSMPVRGRDYTQSGYLPAPQPQNGYGNWNAPLPTAHAYSYNMPASQFPIGTTQPSVPAVPMGGHSRQSTYPQQAEQARSEQPSYTIVNGVPFNLQYPLGNV